MLRSLTPLPSQIHASGSYTVKVEMSDSCVMLTESNPLGQVTMCFTAEEARQIALFLLRASNALPRDEGEDAPIKVAVGK